MSLSNATDRTVLVELGERLARARLARNLTQPELAREAGVGARTIARIESGESTQMTSLVRVLRALGLLGNLDALVPPPMPSPLELLRRQGKVRQRATGRRGGDGGGDGGSGDDVGDDHGGDA